MASYRDTRKQPRPHVADSHQEAGTSDQSAQIIRLKGYRTEQGRASKAAMSPELENLLATLRSEMMIAIGISKGLSETLGRFEGYLNAIDDEIERGEILQLQSTVMKQTSHLRATVLAASADLRRVMPDVVGQIFDVPPFDRSDIIYS